MPRGKFYRPPQRQSRSEGQLAAGETSETGVGVSSAREQDKFSKEHVERPAQELLAPTGPDWSKWGVCLSAVLAGIGLMWHYADISFNVKTMLEDVKDLKRKSEEMLKFSLDASGRISALERRDGANVLPPAAQPAPSSTAASGSASKSK